MLNICEFSRVWEIVESLLVHPNKFPWIVKPYFLTEIIKQTQCELFFLYSLDSLRKSYIFLQSATVSTVVFKKTISLCFKKRGHSTVLFTLLLQENGK